MPCQLIRVSFSACALVGAGCEPPPIRDNDSNAGTASTADMRNTDTTGRYDPRSPSPPLPAHCRWKQSARYDRPAHSTPACPTSARLIAAIPGPISELARPCIASAR